MASSVSECSYRLSSAERERKYSHIQTLFIGVLAVLNVLSVKIIALNIFDLFTLNASVGVFGYVITFPCTDVVSELFGKRRSTRLVWQGFAVNILVVIGVFAAIALPPADFWVQHQARYAEVIGAAPRIVAASLIAYIVSQHFDVWFFHFLLPRTGKFFWRRSLGSTSVSQLLDTLVFTLIAFYKTPFIPGGWKTITGILLPLVFTEWLLKMALTAGICLPATLVLNRWIGYSNALRLPDEDYAELLLASRQTAEPQ